MRKQVRAYNVLFPIWFLLIFPITWLIVLPANFLIDSAVVIIACSAMKLEGKKALYKRVILPVWIFGFVADIVGAGLLIALLLLTSTIENDWWRTNVLEPISFNPFASPFALLIVLAAIAAAGLLIYFLNLKITLRKVDIEPAAKRRLALCLALATAPYLYLVPSQWLYGG